MEGVAIGGVIAMFAALAFLLYFKYEDRQQKKHEAESKK